MPYNCDSLLVFVTSQTHTFTHTTYLSTRSPVFYLSLSYLYSMAVSYLCNSQQYPQNFNKRKVHHSHSVSCSSRTRGRFLPLAVLNSKTAPSHCSRYSAIYESSVSNETDHSNLSLAGVDTSLLAAGAFLPAKHCWFYSRKVSDPAAHESLNSDICTSECNADRGICYPRAELIRGR